MDFEKWRDLVTYTGATSVGSECKALLDERKKNV